MKILTLEKDHEDPAGPLDMRLEDQTNGQDLVIFSRTQSHAFSSRCGRAGASMVDPDSMSPFFTLELSQGWSPSVPFLELCFIFWGFSFLFLFLIPWLN